jgi:hypothetical protein
MAHQIDKVTDLTQLEGQAPTDRAVVHIHKETVRVKVEMPFRLGAFQMAAKLIEGSAQSTTIATLLLVIAGCFTAGAAAAIGAPTLIALIAGLCGPLFFFACVRVITRLTK